MQSRRFTVKSSTIPTAGSGVFATTSHTQEVLMCYYAGYDLQPDAALYDSTDHAYALFNPYNGGGVRIGYRVPEHDTGVGQLINDSHSIRFPTWLDSFNKANRICQDYTRNSQNCANVKLGEQFLMYATKDIQEGQELFFHYGQVYWLDNILRTSEKPIARLLALLLLGDRAGSLAMRRLDGCRTIYLANKPLTETSAQRFIRQFLVLRIDSGVWTSCDCQGSSAVGKVTTLVNHLLDN